MQASSRRENPHVSHWQLLHGLLEERGMFFFFLGGVSDKLPKFSAVVKIENGGPGESSKISWCPKALEGQKLSRRDYLPERKVLTNAQNLSSHCGFERA
jgi:hypothetical protein